MNMIKKLILFCIEKYYDERFSDYFKITKICFSKSGNFIFLEYSKDKIFDDLVNILFEKMINKKEIPDLNNIQNDYMKRFVFIDGEFITNRDIKDDEPSWVINLYKYDDDTDEDMINYRQEILDVFREKSDNLQNMYIFSD